MRVCARLFAPGHTPRCTRRLALRATAAWGPGPLKRVQRDLLCASWPPRRDAAGQKPSRLPLLFAPRWRRPPAAVARPRTSSCRRSWPRAALAAGSRAPNSAPAPSPRARLPPRAPSGKVPRGPPACRGAGARGGRAAPSPPGPESQAVPAVFFVRCCSRVPTPCCSRVPVPSLIAVSVVAVSVVAAFAASARVFARLLFLRPSRRVAPPGYLPPLSDLDAGLVPPSVCLL